MPGQRAQRRPRRRPATGAAGGVPRRPPGGSPGAAIPGPDAAGRRGGGDDGRGDGGGCADGGRRRPAGEARAVGADLRGRHGRQPGVRADGGGRGSGAWLLRRAPAGVPGGRAAVQLADSTGLFPPLRGGRRLPPCLVLPIPGRLGGRRRRGGALAAVRDVDAGVPAGSGGGGAGGVGRLAGALGPCRRRRPTNRARDGW